MTRSPRSSLERWFCGATLAALLAAGWGSSAARAEPPVAVHPPLAPGELARIWNKDGTLAFTLTSEMLGRVLVARVMPDLEDVRSSAFTILRELLEEVVVGQEAERLAITVTDPDVNTLEGTLDKRLRDKSGGLQTLTELRKSKGMTREGLRWGLRLQLLEERVAAHPSHLGRLPDDENQRMSQVSVVVAELLKDRSQFVWGVKNAWGIQPANLAPGVLVLARGKPVMRDLYGWLLYHRMDEADLKEIVSQECTAKLLETEGVMLSEAEMNEEMAYRERLWLVQRLLVSQDAWRKVEYPAFLEGSLHKTVAEVKADRFYRAYYGLVRRERARITEPMVQKEFAAKKDTHYGPAILVEEFQVSFERKNALLQGGGKRDQREANQIASALLSRVRASGRPFEDAAKDVVAQYVDPRTRLPDPTVRYSRTRLFNVSANQILYEKAALLKDGETSGLVETLSEIHVMQRKGLEPAQTLETVKDAVREHLAGVEVQYVLRGSPRKKDAVTGLDEMGRADKGLLDDPARVQVRVPLRGD